MKLKQLMHYCCSLALLLTLAGGLALADTTPEKRGTLSGGVQYELPTWFKESFLDIAEDVQEAKDANKHVLLYFHLNECPYCARMLREAFEPEPYASYIQKNFDSIGVNIKGDREIAFTPEVTVMEKELAEKLKVKYTPTIVFLDSNNNAVVRLNGYRSPQRFKHILDYVQSNAYEKSTLAEYLAEHQEKNVYTLRDNPLFKVTSDLAAEQGPLAVIFEDSACDECNAFHDKLLAREDVQEELKKLTVVRLDTDSTEEITTPDGEKMTAKAWADKLDMLYRPGVVLFDAGKEIERIDGLLFSFHFKEIFRFVAGGYYKTMTMRDYSHQRQEELLAAGVDINLAE